MTKSKPELIYINYGDPLKIDILNCSEADNKKIPAAKVRQG